MTRLFATLSLALLACHPAPTPESVLDAYARHLRRGELDAAYVLTTERYHRTHDLAAFAAMVARRPLFDAHAMSGKETRLVVELVPDGAEPVVLRSTGEQQLRLVDDPLEFYPRSTPEEALASFVRAVHHDRLDHLVELLAPADRVSLQSAGPAMPKRLIELAARIEARLFPTAGMPEGVLEDASSNTRLLLGDGDAVTVVKTTDGWSLTGLP